MTCLEHIIENTLCRFEEGKSPEEIKKSIDTDINKPYVKISSNEIFEICQYVYYCWCNNNISPEKLSNSDRICAMSDEELTIFLDNLTCNCIDCAGKNGRNRNCEINKIETGRYCTPKDIMFWLQQEDNNEKD